MILFEYNTYNSPNVTRTYSLGGDEIICFINKSTFSRFKNPFANITSRSKVAKLNSANALLTISKTLLYEQWQQHKQVKVMTIDRV